MKKQYQTPVLNEEVVEIEDVIAASGTFGGGQAGDISGNFPWFN